MLGVVVRDERDPKMTTTVIADRGVIVIGWRPRHHGIARWANPPSGSRKAGSPDRGVHDLRLRHRRPFPETGAEGAEAKGARYRTSFSFPTGPTLPISQPGSLPVRTPRTAFRRHLRLSLRSRRRALSRPAEDDPRRPGGASVHRFPDLRRHPRDRDRRHQYRRQSSLGRSWLIYGLPAAAILIGLIMLRFNVNAPVIALPRLRLPLRRLARRGAAHASPSARGRGGVVTIFTILGRYMAIRFAVTILAVFFVTFLIIFLRRLRRSLEKRIEMRQRQRGHARAHRSSAHPHLRRTRPALRHPDRNDRRVPELQPDLGADHRPRVRRLGLAIHPAGRFGRHRYSASSPSRSTTRRLGHEGDVGADCKPNFSTTQKSFGTIRDDGVVAAAGERRRPHDSAREGLRRPWV